MPLLTTVSPEPGLPFHLDARGDKRLSVEGVARKVAKARRVPAAQLLLSDEAGSQAPRQLFLKQPFR